MKKIITHNGPFHADDVFAMAALQLYFANEELEIIRTRDEEIIKSADWAFDVGSVYDPEDLRFDHHQPNGPVRENGIPYAAFGLVWKHVGEEVSGSKEVADKIEADIVLPIDANDNGVTLYELKNDDVVPFEMSSIIRKFNPIWNSEEDYDKQFLQTVNLAKMILIRFIENAKAKIKMAEIVEQVYQAADDKRVLIFDKPVSSKLCIQYHETLAAVLPDDPKVSSNWLIVAIPVKETGFDVRFKFPEEWGGLRNEELAKISGIEDAVFCHRNCHLLITGSKETAVAAAKKYAV